MLLTALANKYQSDKGTLFQNAHGYTTIYEMLFAGMRQLPINLLEIGLAIGGPELGGKIDRKVTKAPSVAMWKEYFPCAALYGFDISDFAAFEDDRFKFIRGDMGSIDDLDKIVALNVQFDVIIDDASHASYHQLLAMSRLFRLLKPGGLYIVEDMDSRLPYEQSLPAVPAASGILRQMQDYRLPPVSVLGIDLDSVLNQVGTIALFTKGDLDRLSMIDRQRRGKPRVPYLKALERALKGKQRIVKLAVMQRLDQPD